MEIVVVSQYFWPERFGINGVVNRLVESGIHVDVVTGMPNYPEGEIFDGYGYFRPSRERALGAEVLRVPMFPRGDSSATRLAINYLSFMISASLIAPFRLSRRRYDAVFVYLPSPILAAVPALILGRIKRADVVLWVQDLWPGSIEVQEHLGGRFVRNLLTRVVRFIYNRAHTILISSEAFRGPVSAILQSPESSRKIRYYPNSFDPAPASNFINSKAIPEFDCDFPVVIAGNIGRAQAVKTILDAAETLRSETRLKFYFVGTGSMDSYVRERAEAAGLHNVVLCGEYPIEMMPAIFEGSSALLLALASNDVFTATVPSRFQAYLSAGKPILCAADGETARLTRVSGSGLVAGAENVEELVEILTLLLDMPDEARERMGCCGRAYFEQEFSAPVLSTKLIGVFKELLYLKE